MKSRKEFLQNVLTNFAFSMLQWQRSPLFQQVQAPTEGASEIPKNNAELSDGKYMQEVKKALLKKLPDASPVLKDVLTTDPKKLPQEQRVLQNMIEHLIQKTASSWNFDKGNQVGLLTNLVKAVQEQMKEFQDFQDHNKRNLQTVLADGRARIEWDADATIIQELGKGGKGWDAYDRAQVQILREQCEYLEADMGALRKKIYQRFVGPRELEMNELIQISGNLSKEPRAYKHFTDQQKNALATILLVVKNLKLRQAETLDAATPEAEKPVKEKKELPVDVKQNRDTFLKGRDALLSTKEFQREVRDYTGKYREIVNGCYVFFNNKFKNVRVQIVDQTTRKEIVKDLDLGGKSLCFVSPDKAEKFAGEAEGTDALYRLKTEDLVLDTNGQAVLTPNPALLDWSLLEEGWNVAKDLYQNFEKLNPTQKGLTHTRLMEYKARYPQFFSDAMKSYLATQADNNAAKDILKVISAVEAADAYYRNGTKPEKNPFEQDGKPTSIGLERMAAEAVKKESEKTDQGLLKGVDKDFLEQINYGLTGKIKGEKKSPVVGEVATATTAPTVLDTEKFFLPEIMEVSTTQEYLKTVKDFIAESTSNEFFKDAPQQDMKLELAEWQGIKYNNAKSYFEKKLVIPHISEENKTTCLQMLDAIAVLDQLYKEGQDAAIFSYDIGRINTDKVKAGKKLNSGTGAAAFNEAYKTKEGKDVTADMKTALESVCPKRSARGEIPNSIDVEGMKEFLNGARLDTIRYDQGETFIAKNVNGAAFIKTMDTGYLEGFRAENLKENTKRPLYTEIEGNLKSTLIASSDSAKEIKQRVVATLEKLFIDHPDSSSIKVNSIEVTKDNIKAKLANAWDKLITVAMVSIPGRLNESVAFKLNPPEITIPTTPPPPSETPEKPGEEEYDLDLRKPQVVVVDVFKTWKVTGLLDAVGKTFTSPWKILGADRKIWTDMVDYTDMWKAGSDKRIKEKTPEEGRFEVAINIQKKNIDNAVNKLKDSSVPVKTIMDDSYQVTGLTDELPALKGVLHQYFDEGGNRRERMEKIKDDKNMSVEQVKDMKFSDFIKAVDTSIEVKAGPADIEYKNGMYSFNLTPDMLAKEKWNVDVELSNGIIHFVFNRYKMMKPISQRDFADLKANGVLPEKINGEDFKLETYNQLLQGSLKQEQITQIMKEDPGILKLAQPVGVNKSVLGFLILSTLLLLPKACTGPQATIDVTQHGGSLPSAVL